MSTRIRPAELGDMRVLRRMIHALAHHHGERASVSEAQLHMALFGARPMGEALLVDAVSQILGYALLTTHWRPQDSAIKLEVAHLFVVPEARGQGHGRRLMAAAEARARAIGAERLALGTLAENTSAQSFYRHLGLAEAPLHGPRFMQAL